MEQSIKVLVKIADKKMYNKHRETRKRHHHNVRTYNKATKIYRKYCIKGLLYFGKLYRNVVNQLTKNN
jgi:hypothetical protein